MGSPERADTLVEQLRRDRIAAAVFGEQTSTTTLGRFEILGSLGRGGMGEVLEARDPTLDRVVALKLLRGDTATLQPRLVREAQALARLSHPNVVQVYEVGLVDDRAFVAMERLRGQTLHAWQQTPRSAAACLAAYRQAGAGLSAAHAVGLIHRDFKPGNCMIDEQGRVRVLDFGLARAASDELAQTEADQASQDPASGDSTLLAQLLTREGAVLGTIAYMAPEQLLGAAADARSDQFGFCVALFEALHGQRPFAGRTGAQLLLAIQRQDVVAISPRDSLPAVPSAIDRIVRRGLALDPADRWPNMDALLDALASVERGRSRRVTWMAGVGLVVVGSVAALGLRAWMQPGPCDAVRELAAPAWTSEQQLAVEQALTELDAVRGPEVWRAVSRSLDRYADAWVQARVSACEATHVQRSAGPHTLELRLACLDRRMRRMAALVEQLSTLDRPGLAQAVVAAESLPSLAACTDADELLRSELELGPSERARSLRVERLVDEGWALRDAGRPVDALSKAEAAVEQLAALPEQDPIVAEARLLRGTLHFDARRSAAARDDLHAAFRSAERAGEPTLLRESLLALTRLEVWASKPSAAEAWLLVARADARQPTPTDEAALARAEAQHALATGDPTRAIALLELAVSRYRSVTAPPELELALALRLLGEARAEAGDRLGARTAYADSLALARANAALLMQAQTHHDIGTLELTGDGLVAARAAYQAALAIQLELFGERAPVSVHTRIGLAKVALYEGELDTAAREAEAAKAIAEIEGALEPEDRGLLGMLLGSVHLMREDPTAALADYEWAEASFSAMPEVDHGAVAMARSGAADCLLALGRLDDARRAYERALATLTTHVPPTHQRWLYPQKGLGHVLVEQGDYAAALPLLERALDLLRAGPEDPETEASIRRDLEQARHGRQPESRTP
jgi:tetratricopeptide (TPR) repeat protein